MAEVTTRRALEIVLSRCKLNGEAERSLKYLLASECEKSAPPVRQPQEVDA